jgi:guanine nucleotide-binding protein subunit alpha
LFEIGFFTPEFFLTCCIGSGESGKSTTVKQMKILHQGGYDKHELFTWRIFVYKNLMESALALVQAVQKFGYQYENEKNNVSFFDIKRHCLTFHTLSTMQITSPTTN